MSRNIILFPFAAQSVVTLNIHGLLAKRALGRIRVNGESEKPSYGSREDFGRHDSVFSVRGARESCNPGIGVLAIERRIRANPFAVRRSCRSTSQTQNVDTTRRQE
jgi:hypothetical protein